MLEWINTLCRTLPWGLAAGSIVRPRHSKKLTQAGAILISPAGVATPLSSGKALSAVSPSIWPFKATSSLCSPGGAALISEYEY
jgi:hypothetical protein